MSAANKRAYIVKNEFSSTPGSRHIFEGDFSGELFRKDFLKPAFEIAVKDNVILEIVLDGTSGFGTSFLEEAFGGLIRNDKFTLGQINQHICFISKEEPDLIDDIKAYLREAANGKK